MTDPSRPSDRDQTTEHVKEQKKSSRFLEITGILRKHDIMHGLTPEKLRDILEDLGPTYIKLGQILSTRSDILPQEYCDELGKLRSDAVPMPFSDVLSVIEESYGNSWNEVFESIEEKPLGAASIAQVHRARLKTGEDVVVKVQRRGIYDTMNRDINLLHKAVKFLPVAVVRSTLNLEQVLDELWVVAQQEMNFLQEAENMEEFARFNKDVRYIDVPKLYRHLTTDHVLVMDYVDVIPIDDKETLLKEGYDLEEIGTKLVDNYVKQFLDDGFFHADPHPGNVGVRGGRIVWFDMGMMGRLTPRDQQLILEAVDGIAQKDTGKVEDAVLGLGEFTSNPNRTKLYKDLDDFMVRYFSQEMGNLDVANVIKNLVVIMRQNDMVMPQALTMLARGLTQVEGVLVEISPDISILDVASNHMKQYYLDFDNMKSELKKGGYRLFSSYRNMVELPTLAAKILREYDKGQTRINLDLHSAESLSQLLRHLVRNIVTGLCIAALLISSSIICTTDMWPKLFGIPALGAIGFMMAVATGIFVVVRYIIQKKKR